LLGNALDSDTIRHALEGMDAVVQTLGVDFAPRSTFECTTLFSQSTRIVVDAMKIAGVKRLIAVTGLGAGDNRGYGGLLYDAAAFPLLLKRAYDDKDVQEWIIRSSGLDPSSRASTKGSSLVPGLAKQTSMPALTAVATSASAPFMRALSSNHHTIIGLRTHMLERSSG